MEKNKMSCYCNMIMYQDTEQEALNNIEKSDLERKKYYEAITGWRFGNKEKYTMIIDSSIGIDDTVNSILDKLK